MLGVANPGAACTQDPWRLATSTGNRAYFRAVEEWLAGQYTAAVAGAERLRRNGVVPQLPAEVWEMIGDLSCHAGR